MPRSGWPSGATPSAASRRTAAGSTPSPHALSTGAVRGSATVTDRPRSAQRIAVARPTGPPPTTRTSIMTPRAPRRSAASALHLAADPHRQQRRVEHRERRRGDPRRPGQRQRESLDDHRDVVRVGEPAVRSRPHQRFPGQHDHARRPALAERGDAPPAQRVRGHRHGQHRPAERGDERPVPEQRLEHAAGDQPHVQRDHHGEVPEAVLRAAAAQQPRRVPGRHDELGDPLAGDEAEQHPVDGHLLTTAAAPARRSPRGRGRSSGRGSRAAAVRCR